MSYEIKLYHSSRVLYVRLLTVPSHMARPVTYSHVFFFVVLSFFFVTQQDEEEFFLGYGGKRLGKSAKRKLVESQAEIAAGFRRHMPITLTTTSAGASIALSTGKCTPVNNSKLPVEQQSSLAAASSHPAKRAPANSAGMDSRVGAPRLSGKNLAVMSASLAANPVTTTGSTIATSTIITTTSTTNAAAIASSAAATPSTGTAVNGNSSSSTPNTPGSPDGSATTSSEKGKRGRRDSGAKAVGDSGIGRRVVGSKSTSDGRTAESVIGVRSMRQEIRSEGISAKSSGFGSGCSGVSGWVPAGTSGTKNKGSREGHGAGREPAAVVMPVAGVVGWQQRLPTRTSKPAIGSLVSGSKVLSGDRVLLFVRVWCSCVYGVRVCLCVCVCLLVCMFAYMCCLRLYMFVCPSVFPCASIFCCVGRGRYFAGEVFTNSRVSSRFLKTCHFVMPVSLLRGGRPRRLTDDRKTHDRKNGARSRMRTSTSLLSIPFLLLWYTCSGLASNHNVSP